MLKRIFLEHPQRVRESYPEHFRSAVGFAYLMLGCSVAALVHALLPCLFENTASRTVARLYQRMIVNRIDITGEKLRRR